MSDAALLCVLYFGLWLVIIVSQWQASARHTVTLRSLEQAQRNFEDIEDAINRMDKKIDQLERWQFEQAADLAGLQDRLDLLDLKSSHVSTADGAAGRSWTEHLTDLQRRPHLGEHLGGGDRLPEGGDA